MTSAKWNLNSHLVDPTSMFFGYLQYDSLYDCHKIGSLIFLIEY